MESNIILLIPLAALLIALLLPKKKRRAKRLERWERIPGSFLLNQNAGPHRLHEQSLHHITNPTFWLDSNGNTPELGIQITLEDVTSGRYKPCNPDLHDEVVAYLKLLQQHGSKLG